MESGDDEDLPREGPTDIDRRPQDDYVNRRRPQPAHIPAGGLTLTGALGDSDRKGFRRLYLSRDLKRYVEFDTADVIEYGDIPADQPPFIGEMATSVTLRPAARFEFTRTHTADDFDIEFSPLRVPGAPRGRYTWLSDQEFCPTIIFPPIPPGWSLNYDCPL